MHALKLAIIATLAICLQCRRINAEPMGNQFDALKNQFLPAEYKNRNFTMDELKKILHEKCKKAAGGGTENATLHHELERAATTLTTCLAGIANMTALQAEINEARPIGELDTVFNKYCSKTPIALKCLQDFNAKLQRCLSVKERQQSVVLMRITSGLIDFMCTRGGDHIALFVAEEGPECLEANREAIYACLNSSFAHALLPATRQQVKVLDLFDLPELVLEPEHCVDLERFQACTIHHLEQCREITPANVAESVFKFIKNETQCNDFMQAKAKQRPILLKAGTAGGTGAVVNGVGSSVLNLLLGSAVMFLVSEVIRM